jgi:CRP-like cAMP-binding protein
VTGAVLPLLAVLLLRGVRRLDEGQMAPEGVFEMLRAVPAFASLPVATVENLAQRARFEEFDAGRDVVRQGDPGDTFYVIADGAVRVTENGAFMRTQRDGEFFGEIALLHEVPRTATVHTVERTTLLALDQDEFLSAVGAHPRTRHELHGVASFRLADAEPYAD